MQDYASSLEQHRRRKDEAFARDPRSPLPHHERHRFQGLKYYPPDPAWRLRATLVPHDPPRHVRMQASDGAVKHYENVGEFRLATPAGEVRIQAYESAGGHGLFIPFRDRTSGKETYGAGRYLDAQPPEAGDAYVLDFNLAYNPHCAYDDAYSCPFPPPENWLQVEVRAGEKTYKDHT